jgi:hypothetical protein
MDNNAFRYQELSLKLFKLGESLLKEGEDINDYTITNTGNFLIFISGVILDEDDVDYINNIFAMYSAKKLLEEHAGESFDLDKITKVLKKLNNGEK